MYYSSCHFYLNVCSTITTTALSFTAPVILYEESQASSNQFSDIEIVDVEPRRKRWREDRSSSFDRFDFFIAHLDNISPHAIAAWRDGFGSRFLTT